MKKILLEITYNKDETLQVEITEKIRKIKGIHKIMILRFSKPDHPLGPRSGRRGGSGL